MTLTLEQKKKYIEKGGVCCPYCESTNIEGSIGFTTFDDGTACQHVECLNCGKGWNDVMTLTGIEEKDGE